MTRSLPRFRPLEGGLAVASDRGIDRPRAAPTRTGGERIFRSRGFQTRELAEAWLVPVRIQSTDPASPRSRVVYVKR